MLPIIRKSERHLLQTMGKKEKKRKKQKMVDQTSPKSEFAYKLLGFFLLSFKKKKKVTKNKTLYYIVTPWV